MSYWGLMLNEFLFAERGLEGGGEDSRIKLKGWGARHTFQGLKACLVTLWVFSLKGSTATGFPETFKMLGRKK